MEVNAQNVQQVMHVLSAAAGHDEAARTAAHHTLTTLEEMPGFLSCLLEVFALEQTPPQLRFLAIITFKNTIERQWSKNVSSLGGNAIQQKEAEKFFLRGRLLTLFHIAELRWAKQFAIIVARVARFDWPKQWADLFTGILTAVQSSRIAEVECGALRNGKPSNYLQK